MVLLMVTYCLVNCSSGGGGKYQRNTNGEQQRKSTQRNWIRSKSDPIRSGGSKRSILSKWDYPPWNRHSSCLAVERVSWTFASL